MLTICTPAYGRYMSVFVFPFGDNSLCFDVPQSHYPSSASGCDCLTIWRQRHGKHWSTFITFISPVFANLCASPKVPCSERTVIGTCDGCSVWQVRNTSYPISVPSHDL